MGENETKLLEGIASNTQSDLIVFFVLMVVAMVIVFLPLYALISKNQKESLKVKNESDEKRQALYIEREGRIIDAFQENSAVIAKLTTTLDNHGTAELAAIAGIKTTLDANVVTVNTAILRVHERIDVVSADMAQLRSGVEKVCDKM